MDYRGALHLPKVRGDAGADPDELPRQRRGITPQMHGRYPDFDCLEHASHWDAVTRAAVLDRIERVPERSFFSEEQAATLAALCDVVLAQEREPRIPVLAFIDRKLAEGRFDGYQYADMPDDRVTWTIVAEGLDEAACERGATSFAEASESKREQIVDAFAAASLRGRAWLGVNQARAWAVVTRSMLGAFYAHPWAWNEIGFGGPAYPRGYARLGIGLSEVWEGIEAVAPDPGGETGEHP